MAKITYKGITQNSSIEKKLTDEEFKQIAIDYYRKTIEVYSKRWYSYEYDL